MDQCAINKRANSVKASFGTVQIFGHKYEKDIIIHVDGSITKRKKKKSRDLKPIYGHTPLSEKELTFLEEEKPKIVFVGTGYEAALPITEAAQKILDRFELLVMPTPEIIEKIEHEKRKAVAIIHVTC
jgi:hypothetical protein